MHPQTGTTRRDFVKTSGVVAAAAAATLVVPPSVHAATDNRIKIGLVGCGNRGSGAAANACRADEGIVLWAMGDMFQDQLDSHVKDITTEVGAQIDCPKE